MKAMVIALAILLSRCKASQCESPNFMPLVACDGLRYDGCHWACGPLFPGGVRL